MESQTETQPPVLVLALRDGNTIELRPAGSKGSEVTYVTRSGDQQLHYPLGELESARLVVDTSAPRLPNGMPMPAIRLQMRDKTAATFTTANPAEATQLLEAIYQQRPELRVAAPPPSGGAAWGAPPPNYGFGYAGYAGYAPPGYAPYVQPVYQPPHPSGISSSDRNLAGLCHLSVFFAPIILPLVIWLVVRDSQPYASSQAKQAFFFHLIFYGASFLLSGVLFVVYFAVVAASLGTVNSSNPGALSVTSFFSFAIFYLLAGCLGIVDIVFSIIGAVQAFQGKPFHYPLLGKL